MLGIQPLSQEWFFGGARLPCSRGCAMVPLSLASNCLSLF
jgi:hypothetical protein